MSEPRGSVLAIDHGTKRTGFAVTDPLRVSVTPLDTYHGRGNRSPLVEHIAARVAEREIECVVVGYPLDLHGSAGAQAKAVDEFIARLAARLPDLEIVRHDERLTTKEAEARLQEAGYHGEERKARRDSWSAMVLLEDWIRAGEPR